MQLHYQSASKAAFFIALLFTLPVCVAAQESIPIKPGERVRVIAPDLDIHKRAVIFVAVRGDTLIVSRDATM